MDSETIMLVVVGLSGLVAFTVSVTAISQNLVDESNPSPSTLIYENLTINKIEHDCKQQYYFYQSSNEEYCSRIGIHP